MKASSATAVFQFTLTCSHGPIFICFVSVTTFSVALEALICSLLVSKCSAKNSDFTHSDGRRQH